MKILVIYVILLFLTACSTSYDYKINIIETGECTWQQGKHFERNYNCYLKGELVNYNVVVEGEIFSEKGLESPARIRCNLEQGWCDNWVFYLNKPAR